MARAEWIPIRVDLADDPAVVVLARRLRMSEREVVGLLVELWAWARSQTVTGYVEVEPAWVDTRMRAPGLCAALVTVGWLELEGSGVRLARWERWLSKGAKARLQAAERQWRYKAGKASKTGAAPFGVGGDGSLI